MSSRDQTIVVRITIVEPPKEEGELLVASISAAAIAKIVLVAGAAAFVWFSLDKIYKITRTPEGLAGLAVGGVGGAGIVLLLWWLWNKRG